MDLVSVVEVVAEEAEEGAEEATLTLTLVGHK